METATALALVAVASTAAGTAVAVDGAQKQAKAARQSAALEMEQYAAERKQAAQDAIAQEAASMRDTQGAISAIVARRAASGLDPYTGTGRTLIDATLDDGAADLETIRGNYGRADKQLAYGAQASSMRTAGTLSSLRSSQTASVIGGLGSMATQGGRYLSTSR